MFSHIRIGSNDIAKSRRFYDATLGALGIEGREMGGALFYIHGDNRFAVGTPIEGEAKPGNGGTIGFIALNDEAVAKFHEAGLANGGTCEGAPGPRPKAGNRVLAYLRDPDGNKICAMSAAAPAG